VSLDWDARDADWRLVGGSDVAKLLGLSPYGNAADVYERVVLGVEHPTTPIQLRGQVLEPVLRGLLVAERPDWRRVTRADDYHAHPGLPLRAQVDDVFGTPDGEVVVDYKSVSRWAKGYGEAGTDEVPEHYLVQLAVEMLCADTREAFLVCGFGDDDRKGGDFVLQRTATYRAMRDEALDAVIENAVNKFWAEHVQPRRAPDMKPWRGKKPRAKKAVSNG